MVNREEPRLRPFAPALRRERRQGERGAAVFIVVMVLTLLTAMGVFAVRSASLADQAAGYDREGAQASLVAQYAVTATAAYMASGVSGVILDRLELSKTEAAPPICESNFLSSTAQAATPRPPCYRLNMSDLQTSFTAASSESLFAPSNLPSSVGNQTSSLNVNETVNATFVVEITEAAKTGVPTPGYLAGSTPVMMTLTAISQVRPMAACNAGTSAPTAGQQAMRAMITAESTPK